MDSHSEEYYTMIWINLLPQAEKKKLFYLQIDQIINRLLFIIVILLVCSSIVLLGIRFSLQQETDEINNQIDSLQSQINSDKNKETQDQIQILNQLVRRANDIRNQNIDLSAILVHVSDITPTGVTFTRIDYDNSSHTFNIKGIALKREDLIKFTNNIEESDYFFQTDSPISNFTEENNLQFELSFVLENRND